MQRKTATLLSTAVAVAWIVAVIGAFWFLDLRYWRPFLPEELAVFNGEAIRQLPPALGAGPVVIHFHDAHCPCSSFTRSHLDDLQASLAPTRQFQLSKGDRTATLPFPDLATALPAYADTLQRLVPASPAVGIWDARGELAYFGPYSGGATCGSGKSFVDITLNALSRGENPRFINTDATGCFCAW